MRLLLQRPAPAAPSRSHPAFALGFHPRVRLLALFILVALLVRAAAPRGVLDLHSLLPELRQVEHELSELLVVGLRFRVLARQRFELVNLRFYLRGGHSARHRGLRVVAHLTERDGDCLDQGQHDGKVGEVVRHLLVLHRGLDANHHGHDRAAYGGEHAEYDVLSDVLLRFVLAPHGDADQRLELPHLRPVDFSFLVEAVDYVEHRAAVVVARTSQVQPPPPPPLTRFGRRELVGLVPLDG
mmetsp:Transcript_1620/g.6736  ORF Transcript_1620/g.6736 Transcript_1620/m.6736 type:complete len:241 (-) Transcript_1620:385-1107(-)